MLCICWEELIRRRRLVDVDGFEVVAILFEEGLKDAF